MLGIVIITYNSKDVIGACLEACVSHTSAPIVVVDNCSTDGTQAEVQRRHPDVRLVANAKNLGFAAGVNQGVASLGTGLVLILNPDVILQTGIEALIEAAQDPRVGAVGGHLVDATGRTQIGFNVRSFPQPLTLAFEALGLNAVWPGNPVNRQYRKILRAGTLVEADQPAGAFLLINREAWARLGGLDERFYPVWFEDVDYCKRLKMAGYRILYAEGAVGRHLGGHSVKKLELGAKELYWYGSLLRYAAKHFAATGRVLVCLGVMLASIPRGLAGCLLRGSLKPVSVYSKVMYQAGLCLLYGGAGEMGTLPGRVVQPSTKNRSNAVPF